MTQPLRCWIISDGRRGIENQALGIAEACRRLRPLNLETFTLNPSKIFQALPPRGQCLFKSSITDYGLPGSKPDWVIGCGRQAIAPLQLIKKQYRERVFTVYVQDPRCDPSRFDVVIAPEHDPIRGQNVETMIGSPNRVTETKLKDAASRFAPQINALLAPRIAVLIGGPSKQYDLQTETVLAHIEILRTLQNQGASLMISVSRRTPPALATLYRAFGDSAPNIWFYDPATPNPYFAFLACADALLVTEESTNMLTEACSTGKPVYRLALVPKRPGTSSKFDALHAQLAQRCGVRRLDPTPHLPDLIALNAAYPPLRETDRMAERLWERFDTPITA